VELHVTGLIKPILLILSIISGAPNLGAQTAVYRGRVYTPQNFPRATSCACGMCQNIRSQWRSTAPAQQRAVLTAPGAYRSNHTTPTYNVRQTASQGPSLTPGPAYKTVYRQVRVRVGCHGGVCYFRTVWVPTAQRVERPSSYHSGAVISSPKPVPAPVPAPVRKPAVSKPNVSIVASKPPMKPGPKVLPSDASAPNLGAPEVVEPVKPVSTPQKVVDAMLAALSPPKNAKLFDLGCGDGRVLITAVLGYGVRAVGIEIDEGIAKEARENALNNFVAPSIFIFNGDATKYDLAEAEYATMYLYDDLIGELTDKLKPGTKVASYAHPIPDAKDSSEHFVTIGGTRHVFYTGVIQ